MMKPKLYPPRHRDAAQWLPTWAASIGPALDRDSNRHLGSIGSHLSHLVDRRTMRSQQAAAVEAIWESVAALAFRDELTGLYNRRGAICLGESLLALARRLDCRLLVTYIDVDGLKRVNDRGGHGAGDALLVTAAEVLRQSYRATDLVARLGGDEFLALAVAADEDLEDAVRRRLRDLCEQANATGRCWPLSLSVGTAWFDPQAPRPLAHLIDSADRHLYLQRRERPRRAAAR